MSVKDAILTTRPTSHGRLTTSAASSSCHDEMVAHLAIWNRLLSGDEIDLERRRERPTQLRLSG
jgi:hypothetical protein